MKRTTRADLFGALETIGATKVFTERDVCRQLGVSEYQTRGAMAWCLKAKVILRVGREFRKTAAGDRYTASLYRWTGKTRVLRAEQEGISQAAHRWLRGVSL